MPLKHFTETFLTVVLGVICALTGMLMATLPALPDGAIPWSVLFILSIIYPLSLHSLFQRRRADNTFRNLHWTPAIMLLVWVCLQAVTLASTLTTEDVSVYTWGFSIGAVVLAFIAIVMFCLKVIRRRVPRLLLLAAILVPFATVAFMSENGGQFEEELASLLWGAEIFEVSETGLIAGWFDDTQPEKNLDASEDEEEEEWRERLRKQKEREERIAALRRQDASSTMSSDSSVTSDTELTEASSSSAVSLSSRPTKLPDSGFGWTFIISLLVVAYSGVLHQRAHARIEN